MCGNFLRKILEARNILFACIFCAILKGEFPMTVYELKARYLEKHPNGHFFDPETLKYFGETLSTMRVLRETVQKRD